MVPSKNNKKSTKNIITIKKYDIEKHKSGEKLFNTLFYAFPTAIGTAAHDVAPSSDVSVTYFLYFLIPKILFTLYFLKNILS